MNHHIVITRVWGNSIVVARFSGAEARADALLFAKTAADEDPYTTFEVCKVLGSEGPRNKRVSK